jgi:hypothetical protein
MVHIICHGQGLQEAEEGAGEKRLQIWEQVMGTLPKTQDLTEYEMHEYKEYKIKSRYGMQFL